MSIERDKDFEQLEDIAAMMTENPGIEFENGKYVYYGLDARTAFAVVYISGAWAGWQAAKAQAVPEGSVLVPKLLSDEQYNQLEDVMQDNFGTTVSQSRDCIIRIHNELLSIIQEPNQTPQFNLDEFLIMEERLKHKGGVITADLDRFIAYAEMALEKAKSLKEQK